MRVPCPPGPRSPSSAGLCALGLASLLLWRWPHPRPTRYAQLGPKSTVCRFSSRPSTGSTSKPAPGPGRWNELRGRTSQARAGPGSGLRLPSSNGCRIGVSPKKPWRTVRRGGRRDSQAAITGRNGPCPCSASWEPTQHRGSTCHPRGSPSVRGGHSRHGPPAPSQPDPAALTSTGLEQRWEALEELPEAPEAKK